MKNSRPSPLVLTLAGSAHLLVNTLVWRDLTRRDAAAVRGSKTLWRVLTAPNSGNGLLYLLVGRRRP